MVDLTKAPAEPGGAVEVRPPWEREEGETEEAWLAFRAYRDMPPEERLVKRSAARNVAVLGKWYRDHNWPARVLAFDAHFDSISIEEREKTLRMAAREVALDHAIILADSRELVSRELRKLVTVSRETEMHGLLSPAEIIKLTDTSIKLDRLVRGQSTEHVKQELDVSKLTLEEAETLADLLAKAEKKDT